MAVFIRTYPGPNEQVARWKEHPQDASRSISFFSQLWLELNLVLDPSSRRELLIVLPKEAEAEVWAVFVSASADLAALVSAFPGLLSRLVGA